MRRFGVIFGEGDRHGRVVDGVTCCDICIQFLKMLVIGVRRRAKSTCVCPYIDERCTIWRAVAGNFDGLTIGSLHGAITITSACVEAHQSTGNDSKKAKDAPVGLTPDKKPNGGMRSEFTFLRVIGKDDTVATRITRGKKSHSNFIL